MGRPAAGNPKWSSLHAVLETLRADVRLVLWTIFGIGVLATCGIFILAQFRMMLFTMAMPARSDANVLALLAVLIFWVVVLASLKHCQDWLRIVVGFRFSRLLSAPVIVAAAASLHPDDDAVQAVRDVDEVTEGVSGPILGTLVEMALVPVMVLLLFFIHWAFMALAIFAALLKLGLSAVSHRLISPPLQQANTAYLRGLAAMGDACNAAEAVEAMGFLPALARRLADNIQGGVTGMAHTQWLLRVAQGITSFIDQCLHVAPIVLMAAMGLGGLDVGSGALGIGALLLIGAVTSPFSRLTEQLSEVAELRGAWERLVRLAARERQMRGEVASFPCSDGRLELDRLTVVLPGMSYPIIRDLSFRMEPGQVLSLAGPVGCGKSTLLRAIMGIQLPSSGGCYLDGHSTARWDRSDLARHVGYLPQDVGLANGTVADAIARLGVPDMALVLEAAHRSGAHQLIAGLSKGYSTRLTEHGLSAGQRQRVALARAIYGRPRLVILDEPGAWLDADGLAQLRRLLALLKQDGTSVIFSSHEAGLLQDADHGITLGPLGTQPRASSRKRLPLAAGLTVGDLAVGA